MSAQDYICTVKSVRYLTPTVFELSFEVTKPFDFKGGQFISVVIPKAGPQGRDLRRAYSIASHAEKRPIELCVKRVEHGPGTAYMSELHPGENFSIYAPYGDFIYKPKHNKRVCFVATGTGVAPFRSMVFSKSFIEQPPISTFCLFGIRDESEIIYKEDFQNKSDIKWIPALSRPSSTWTGFKGRVTDYLRAFGSSWLETEYYLCGNGAMIQEVKEILKNNGVTKESMHQEIYYK
ncbi:MAG: FAD-dependent oxidoreductase [Bdellovibrio sp.]|nr:FAD-dependent oxidoreductase [Bdellovibrio sp.]